MMAAPAFKHRIASDAISSGVRGTFGLIDLRVPPFSAASMITLFSNTVSVLSLEAFFRGHGPLLRFSPSFGGKLKGLFRAPASGR
jgi:hypothetical protein